MAVHDAHGMPHAARQRAGRRVGRTRPRAFALLGRLCAIWATSP